MRVHPGAKRPGVRVDAEGRVRVAVSAAPERGRANDAVVAALAGAFGVRSSSISIVAGGSARTKRVRIAGCLPDELGRMVAALPGDVPR